MPQPEQPVHVQSGVMLGVKIFFGVILGILLLFAGTCGAISCLGAKLRSDYAASNQPTVPRPPAHTIEEDAAAAERAKVPPSARPEDEYIAKVQLVRVYVGADAFDRPGIFGEIKNTGERTLKQVTMTIYALDKAGDPVWETTFSPVAAISFDSDVSAPLKPKYSRKFGVSAKEAPSDWARKVKAEIKSIEFAP